jgi:hypothetical protein
MNWMYSVSKAILLKSSGALTRSNVASGGQEWVTVIKRYTDALDATPETWGPVQTVRAFEPERFGKPRIRL